MTRVVKPLEPRAFAQMKPEMAERLEVHLKSLEKYLSSNPSIREMQKQGIKDLLSGVPLKDHGNWFHTGACAGPAICPQDKGD